jgi:hypothetical protein
MGIVSRLAIDAVSIYKFRQKYIKNRNLIAWKFYSQSYPTVSDFKFEKFRVGELETKVISKEYLIKMKKKSRRDKDLTDIRELTK